MNDGRKEEKKSEEKEISVAHNCGKERKREIMNRTLEKIEIEREIRKKKDDLDDTKGREGERERKRERE